MELTYQGRGFQRVRTSLVPGKGERLMAFPLQFPLPNLHQASLGVGGGGGGSRSHLKSPGTVKYLSPPWSLLREDRGGCDVYQPVCLSSAHACLVLLFLHTYTKPFYITPY